MMGVNNRARRAAKRRRQQARTSGTARPTSQSRWHPEPPLDETERAARSLSAALLAVRSDPAVASEQAEFMAAEIHRDRLADLLNRSLTNQIVATVRHGWTPQDLGEITRRRLSARHLPLVAALIAAETGRHPAATISSAWQAELHGLGAPRPPDFTDVTDIANALRLMCLLGQLPPLARTTPPPGSPQAPVRVGEKAEHRVLAKVRALLAKAESTEFPEESEALSAKAQELISTYALDDLAAQADAGAGAPEQPLVVRRLWIEAPYVSAKSMLVDAVADANHCKCVLSEQLGFATLVGRPLDVDAVELLVTSLLVQADRAMLHHRGQGGSARSRTTSFRRSFLISYAVRIGERLHETAADSLATSARSGELVPVVAQVEQRVREATEQLFPHVVERSVRIGNAMGWVAGRAAADLAVFSMRGEIAEQAAG